MKAIRNLQNKETHLRFFKWRVGLIAAQWKGFEKNFLMERGILNTKLHKVYLEMSNMRIILRFVKSEIENDSRKKDEQFWNWPNELSFENCKIRCHFQFGQNMGKYYIWENKKTYFDWHLQNDKAVTIIAQCWEDFKISKIRGSAVLKFAKWGVNFNTKLQNEEPIKICKIRRLIY